MSGRSHRLIHGKYWGSYTDTDGDANFDPYGNTDGDAYEFTNSNADGYSDKYAYEYTYGHANSYTYGDPDTSARIVCGGEYERLRI
ncbi:MAG: hypothetical protein IPG58_17490 [Acidobacteria bacterium]|nr:hypothetical protein [Acidobacteriota bacterium]